MYVYGYGNEAPPQQAQQTQAECVQGCQSAKSEAYRSCQQHAAGSAERETCFRQADADLDSCLKVCGDPGLWPGLATAGIFLLGIYLLS